MSDMKAAIMDAAERRIQLGGLGGFSFRDIAEDVGVKSSSVHYHFPTKDELAAAVVRRWSDYTMETVDEDFARDPNPSRVWAMAMRGTLARDPHMCPCTILGATSQDLPPQVAGEVKLFFERCLGKITEQGLPAKAANELLSTIIGAMVLSNALGDISTYDQATASIRRRGKLSSD